MISIIVAIDEKRGIGKGNDLLFRIPQDFKRMQDITTGHPLVMGRKTHESIGRVLPKRTKIIVTREKDYKVDGAIVCNSLEAGIEKAKESEGSGEIFVFGGGMLFKEAIEKGIVDKLYLTVVKGDYGADTFFPEYEKQFSKVIFKEEHQDAGYRYTFLDLEKTT